MMILVAACGCASWRNDNETIIRVQAKQNPARARRLTLVGVKEMGFGNVDVAAEKFIAAVAADETYGPAHNNLGLLHYDDGNLYQAVLAFEQAMEFMPHDPAVYYNLALASNRPDGSAKRWSFTTKPSRWHRQTRSFWATWFD